MRTTWWRWELGGRGRGEGGYGAWWTEGRRGGRGGGEAVIIYCMCTQRRQVEIGRPGADCNGCAGAFMGEG